MVAKQYDTVIDLTAGGSREVEVIDLSGVPTAGGSGPGNQGI